jgi:hypothetical protein
MMACAPWRRPSSEDERRASPNPVLMTGSSHVLGKPVDTSCGSPDHRLQAAVGPSNAQQAIGRGDINVTAA